ncbi:unnamed protein product [Diamesa tonsa]
MAPTMGLNSNTSTNVSASDSPLSKTYQYRKIMKPMLERKRRARINRCLDELKELITGALQNTDGEENITKLEKADILELTVRHFHNLKRQNKFYVKPEQNYADRFRDGFSQCAKEVTKFLYNANQNRAGEHIIVHLNDCIRRLDGLTNNSNNNIQITNNNNNNYIPNNNTNNNTTSLVNVNNNLMESAFIRQQQVPQLQQPIKKIPIATQNYLTLPTQHHQSPFERPVKRESFSGDYHNQQKDQDGVWRPW